MRRMKLIIRVAEWTDLDELISLINKVKQFKTANPDYDIVLMLS